MLLKEQISKNVSVASARHAKLELSLSCFVDVVLVPMQNDTVKNERDIVTNTLQNVLRRFVVSRKLYHRTEGRFDSQMVENSDMDDAAVLNPSQFYFRSGECFLFLIFQFMEIEKFLMSVSTATHKLQVHIMSLATKNCVFCSGVKYWMTK